MPISKYSTKQPINRSKWRKIAGKKYFILKRKLLWLKNRNDYASIPSKDDLNHLVFEHSSTLLRPLKDVDMQYQHNKITNLKIASQAISGIKIAPGKSFSLWMLVGKPTKERGFLKGLVLNNGQIGYDYGGGLCQLGNLLYWMLLHSPLEITERYRHSYDVFPDVNRTLPFGSGATLSYNYIDLQFKNSTQHDYQIKLWLSEKKLHGQLLCSANSKYTYKVYEDYHLFHQEQWGGYTRHNAIKRLTYMGKTVIKDELITENHAVMMYNPLLASPD